MWGEGFSEEEAERRLLERGCWSCLNGGGSLTGRRPGCCSGRHLTCCTCATSPRPASLPTRFPTPRSSGGRSSYGRSWPSRASCPGRCAGPRPGSSTLPQPGPSPGPRTLWSGLSTISGPQTVSDPAVTCRWGQDWCEREGGSGGPSEGTEAGRTHPAKVRCGRPRSGGAGTKGGLRWAGEKRDGEGAREAVPAASCAPGTEAGRSGRAGGV